MLQVAVPLVIKGTLSCQGSHITTGHTTVVLGRTAEFYHISSLTKMSSLISSTTVNILAAFLFTFHHILHKVLLLCCRNSVSVLVATPQKPQCVTVTTQHSSSPALQDTLLPSALPLSLILTNQTKSEDGERHHSLS